MWHVAVFSEHQHDQFLATHERFSLVKRDGDVCWRFEDGTYEGQAAALVRIRVSSGAIVVACQEMNAAIELAGGDSFSCGVPIELPLARVFRIGEIWIEVRDSSSSVLPSLEPLHGERAVASGNSPATGNARRGPDAQTVAQWLAAAGRLHRVASSSPTFFDTASAIALDAAGLDAALVLLRDGDQWRIIGSAVPRPEHGIAYERSAVELVLRRPDVWRSPTPFDARDAVAAEALHIDESIVAAPVRNDAGEIIAVLYGVRHSLGDNRRRGIRTLEARVIELIADAVAAGMARREREIESARQRVLLEQAFSPEVAEHLHRHPEALHGQTREVTLLFADLRRFTSLAEDMLPADAYDLLAAVMEALTRAITDHGGVVIDYFGDGVCAMWNAPLDVPDHADRACAAAMQMLQSLPMVSREWQHLAPESLELAIGLHTGAAQVGNSGTQQRLKYGPRGHAVNVASRVLMAAKRFDVSLMATDAVRKRLSSRLVTLKVCTARLPGLDAPLELFTVFPATDATRLQGDLERYAEALEAFERGDLAAAEEHLAQLLTAGPATPAAFLAEQTTALRQGGLGRRAADEFGCTPDAVIEILAK